MVIFKKKDIEEYLNNYSDFSFEIKVLKKLTSMGFHCEVLNFLNEMSAGSFPGLDPAFYKACLNVLPRSFKLSG